MKRPNESDYTSQVAYTRALEEYCDVVAQPEQEPVAWMRPSEKGYDSAFRDHSTVVICTGNPWTGWIPLYTTPPQRTWVGLTDEQIKRIGKLDLDSDYFGLWYDFAKALEAKLKEKNT
jgi:hypothetical protein